MKKFRNIMLCILILSFTFVVLGCTVYNYKIGPVSNSTEAIEVVIPNGTSTKEVAKILKEKGLIRDETFFLLYIKLFHVNSIKASTYQLTPNMGVKNIVKVLEAGNSYNPDVVQITFKEGINMRQIATLISENTNSTYDEVIAKANDMEYINSLIENYWFITDEIKNDDIYYKLEGYLFPNTYEFRNKDVTVEEIFNTMIKAMANALDPYRSIIETGELSVHEILTLASMVEKEAAREQDRSKVASVFINRIDHQMSLGSDVTTRYALKIDDPKKVLSKAQYQTKNPYNTRVTDGSMNGKLPIGPICTVSLSSIKASVEPEDTDYIYFIANIQTLETFFFNNANDFEQKKQELASVNGGL